MSEAEDADDVRIYDEAMANRQPGIPAEFVNALLSAEAVCKALHAAFSAEAAHHDAVVFSDAERVSEREAMVTLAWIDARQALDAWAATAALDLT